MGGSSVFAIGYDRQSVPAKADCNRGNQSPGVVVDQTGESDRSTAGREAEIGVESVAVASTGCHRARRHKPASIDRRAGGNGHWVRSSNFTQKVSAQSSRLFRR